MFKSRTQISPLLAGLLVALYAAGVPAAAESNVPRTARTETEEVRLVLLPTNVTDRRGRVVSGLTTDNFRLFQNGEPQEISFVASESAAPISIAFLLDLSGSMDRQDRLFYAQQTITRLVQRLNPEDSVGLIGFADEQVAWITEFTRDREKFFERLWVQSALGKTALNDAVAAAPFLVNNGARGRKAIVLITDGTDNSSRMTPAEAADLARRISFPIYAIGFFSVRQEWLPAETALRKSELLRRIANETGGRLFPVHDESDLARVVSDLEQQLDHQYLIGYYPAVGNPNGFQAIELEVDRKRWDVRTRSGYYGTATAPGLPSSTLW